jgi:death-on-curing protein
MTTPCWVLDCVVDAIHRQQIAEHGGREGIRDEGLLQSALARPRNAFAYSDPKPDIGALAAAYAFGIAKNHPFFDGNKRVAAVVCETFLLLNGYELTASDTEFYEAFLHLADGTMSEEAMATWIRERLGPAS